MTTLPRSVESQFLDWLADWTRANGAVLSPETVLGIGDDAAILRPAGTDDWVVTTDALADGTDFLVDRQAWEAIGHKALAVNLSDLAAMGARPVSAFVSLMLPRTDALVMAKRLIEGMGPLIRSTGVALSGGDTNVWDGRLVISVTAIGAVPKGQAWRRSGARPGDVMFATGAFGGSIHGRHLTVEPRLSEASWLRSQVFVRAAIDVSDGLSLDAHRLAKASGCGLEFDLERVPIHDDARRGPKPPLDHALSDGEDFELLVAVDPDVAKTLVAQPPPFSICPIGRFTATLGLWSVDTTGNRRAMEPRGWLHGTEE